MAEQPLDRAVYEIVDAAHPVVAPLSFELCERRRHFAITLRGILRRLGRGLYEIGYEDARLDAQTVPRPKLEDASADFAQRGYTERPVFQPTRTLTDDGGH